MHLEPSDPDSPSAKALYTREWRPETPAWGHVLIVHGYAEHCGRYERLATALNGVGLHVHAYDHPGHGQSPGKRGKIRRFSDLVEQLRVYVEQVQRHVDDNAPIFLFAHSMGGLVAIHYLATTTHPVGGAVISSPLLAIPAHVSPLLLRISRVLSATVPWLPVERLQSGAISRDAEEVRAYDTDPLVYHGSIHARTGAELTTAIAQAQECLEKITLPLLVLHGTADRLAPFAGGKRLYDAAQSADKEALFVEGGYHELLNDYDRETTLATILDWFQRHQKAIDSHAP